MSEQDLTFKQRVELHHAILNIVAKLQNVATDAAIDLTQWDEYSEGHLLRGIEEVLDMVHEMQASRR